VRQISGRPAVVMGVSSGIGRIQRFLNKIQRAISFTKNPVAHEKNKARQKFRHKVIGCLHI